MSLHLHRSERADALADGLAGLLSRPLDDPFAAEVVAVPTRGVERWLAQSLATRLGAATGRADGVCAGVEFPSPRRLVAAALAGVLDLDRRDDPWRPERLSWPVLAEIEAAREQSWAAVLWSFLEGRSGSSSEPMPRPGRRWSTAAHLADLFSRYAVQRPAMVQAWAAGRDVDPEERPLGPGTSWQPELWRRVRDRIGRPSPAERLPTACRELRLRPETTALPARLSLFGATRLDPDQLAVLAALADHRDVHLWLTHPSPALWGRLAATLDADGRPSGPRRRDATTTVPRHRLLAYLGRDVRELQILVSTTGVHEDEALPGLDAPPAPAGQRDARTRSLLARLQADISADHPPRTAGERPVLDDGDDSVQLHISHGPDRQVEVLREVLLGLLDDDPTLEPRDIVVLCPDIETFAPLIAATFGLDAGVADDGAARAEHPGHRLRVRLADRSLRRLNPLLSVLDRVLELADSRLPASALLDLAAAPPVARRFGFSEDDLQRMAELITTSGVRWGLDAAHRDRFGLAEFGQNTWTAGLDRMLLGVAMDASGEHFIGTALPLDDVDSGDVELVGRIAEFVSRVQGIVDTVAAPDRTVLRHPLPWWLRTCRDVLDGLTLTSPSETWQSAHAYGELARLAEYTGATDDPDRADAGLSLADVRALLGDAFKGRATRANFRTGTLTMCTMLPMRSVPHRVICLLGVDDTVFPRRRLTDGDDIAAAEPWIGDRDPRSEDRQLLLDAVMAAQDRLIVVYSGVDARTGADKPVSVPIGELLDALEETAVSPDGRSVRALISRRHTLQPFDRANFAPAAARGGRPFSFDLAAREGAVAASGARHDPPDRFAVDDLPPLAPVDEVALTELSRFFSHPSRALLRLRGQLYLGEDDEPPSEQIPINPDGLGTWAIGDRLLQRHLDGVPIPQLAGAEWRRGTLPPRGLGAQTLRPIGHEVESLAASVQPYLHGERVSADVEVHLDGRTVTGTVPAVYGERIVTALYSWLGARHRLQAWLHLLTLTATAPDTPWQAVTIGRGGRSVLGPVGETFARRVLQDLLLLYDLGRNEPLPFAPKTSAVYARVRMEDKSVAALTGLLEREWAGGGKVRGERDADYARFFPASLTELLAPRARAVDVRAPLGEPSRFGSIARRVWQPLLSCEELR